MSEPHPPGDTTANSPLKAPVPAKMDEIFTSKPPEGGGIPAMAWGVAGLAVLVVVFVLVLAGRHKAAAPSTIQPLAAYAASLPLSQLAMSESTSLSGGKSTFIDGHIKNTGSQTVSGVTVQAIFRNDEAMPPQIDTLPLSLIRYPRALHRHSVSPRRSVEAGRRAGLSAYLRVDSSELEHPDARGSHHPGRDKVTLTG